MISAKKIWRKPLPPPDLVKLATPLDYTIRHRAVSRDKFELISLLEKVATAINFEAQIK